MGLRLTDLEEGTKVDLLITSTSGKMKLDAYIKKVLKDDLAVIVLDVTGFLMIRKITNIDI